MADWQIDQFAGKSKNLPPPVKIKKIGKFGKFGKFNTSAGFSVFKCHNNKKSRFLFNQFANFSRGGVGPFLAFFDEKRLANWQIQYWRGFQPIGNLTSPARVSPRVVAFESANSKVYYVVAEASRIANQQDSLPDNGHP